MLNSSLSKSSNGQSSSGRSSQRLSGPAARDRPSLKGKEEKTRERLAARKFESEDAETGLSSTQMKRIAMDLLPESQRVGMSASELSKLGKALLLSSPSSTSASTNELQDNKIISSSAPSTSASTNELQAGEIFVSSSPSTSESKIVETQAEEQQKDHSKYRRRVSGTVAAPKRNDLFTKLERGQLPSVLNSADSDSDGEPEKEKRWDDGLEAAVEILRRSFQPQADGFEHQQHRLKVDRRIDPVLLRTIQNSAQASTRRQLTLDAEEASTENAINTSSEGRNEVKHRLDENGRCVTCGRWRSAWHKLRAIKVLLKWNGDGNVASGPEGKLKIGLVQKMITAFKSRHPKSSMLGNAYSTPVCQCSSSSLGTKNWGRFKKDRSQESTYQAGKNEFLKETHFLQEAFEGMNPTHITKWARLLHQTVEQTGEIPIGVRDSIKFWSDTHHAVCELKRYADDLDDETSSPHPDAHEANQGIRELKQESKRTFNHISRELRIGDIIKNLQDVFATGGLKGQQAGALVHNRLATLESKAAEQLRKLNVEADAMFWALDTRLAASATENVHLLEDYLEKIRTAMRSESFALDPDIQAQIEDIEKKYEALSKNNPVQKYQSILMSAKDKDPALVSQPDKALLVDIRERQVARNPDRYSGDAPAGVSILSRSNTLSGAVASAKESRNYRKQQTVDGAPKTADTAPKVKLRGSVLKTFLFAPVALGHKFEQGSPDTWAKDVQEQKEKAAGKIQSMTSRKSRVHSGPEIVEDSTLFKMLLSNEAMCEDLRRKVAALDLQNFLHEGSPNPTNRDQQQQEEAKESRIRWGDDSEENDQNEEGLDGTRSVGKTRKAVVQETAAPVFQACIGNRQTQATRHTTHSKQEQHLENPQVQALHTERTHLLFDFLRVSVRKAQMMKRERWQSMRLELKLLKAVPTPRALFFNWLQNIATHFEKEGRSLPPKDEEMNWDTENWRRLLEEFQNTQDDDEKDLQVLKGEVLRSALIERMLRLQAFMQSKAEAIQKAIVTVMKERLPVTFREMVDIMKPVVQEEETLQGEAEKITQANFDAVCSIKDGIREGAQDSRSKLHAKLKTKCSKVLESLTTDERQAFEANRKRAEEEQERLNVMATKLELWMPNSEHREQRMREAFGLLSPKELKSDIFLAWREVVVTSRQVPEPPSDGSETAPILDAQADQDREAPDVPGAAEVEARKPDEAPDAGRQSDSEQVAKEATPMPDAVSQVALQTNVLVGAQSLASLEVVAVQMELSYETYPAFVKQIRDWIVQQEKRLVVSMGLQEDYKSLVQMLRIYQQNMEHKNEREYEVKKLEQQKMRENKKIEFFQKHEQWIAENIDPLKQRIIRLRAALDLQISNCEELEEQTEELQEQSDQAENALLELQEAAAWKLKIRNDPFEVRRMLEDESDKARACVAQNDNFQMLIQLAQSKQCRAFEQVWNCVWWTSRYFFGVAEKMAKSYAPPEVLEKLRNALLAGAIKEFEWPEGEQEKLRFLQVALVTLEDGNYKHYAEAPEDIPDYLTLRPSQFILRRMGTRARSSSKDHLENANDTEAEESRRPSKGNSKLETPEALKMNKSMKTSLGSPRSTSKERLGESPLTETVAHESSAQEGEPDLSPAHSISELAEAPDNGEAGSDAESHFSISSRRSSCSSVAASVASSTGLSMGKELKKKKKGGGALTKMHAAATAAKWAGKGRKSKLDQSKKEQNEQTCLREIVICKPPSDLVADSEEAKGILCFILEQEGMQVHSCKTMSHADSLSFEASVSGPEVQQTITKLKLSSGDDWSFQLKNTEPEPVVPVVPPGLKSAIDKKHLQEELSAVEQEARITKMKMFDELSTKRKLVPFLQKEIKTLQRVMPKTKAKTFCSSLGIAKNVTETDNWKEERADLRKQLQELDQQLEFWSNRFQTEVAHQDEHIKNLTNSSAMHWMSKAIHSDQPHEDEPEPESKGIANDADDSTACVSKSASSAAISTCQSSQSSIGRASPTGSLYSDDTGMPGTVASRISSSRSLDVEIEVDDDDEGSQRRSLPLTQGRRKTVSVSNLAKSEQQNRRKSMVASHSLSKSKTLPDLEAQCDSDSSSASNQGQRSTEPVSETSHSANLVEKTKSVGESRDSIELNRKSVASPTGDKTKTVQATEIESRKSVKSANQPPSVRSFMGSRKAVGNAKMAFENMRKGRASAAFGESVAEESTIEDGQEPPQSPRLSSRPSSPGTSGPLTRRSRRTRTSRKDVSDLDSSTFKPDHESAHMDEAKNHWKSVRQSLPENPASKAYQVMKQAQEAADMKKQLDEFYRLAEAAEAAAAGKKSVADPRVTVKGWDDLPEVEELMEQRKKMMKKNVQKMLAQRMQQTTAPVRLAEVVDQVKEKEQEGAGDVEEASPDSPNAGDEAESDDDDKGPQALRAGRRFKKKNKKGKMFATLKASQTLGKCKKDARGAREAEAQAAKKCLNLNKRYVDAKDFLRIPRSVPVKLFVNMYLNEAGEVIYTHHDLGPASCPKVHGWRIAATESEKVGDALVFARRWVPEAETKRAALVAEAQERVIERLESVARLENRVKETELKQIQGLVESGVEVERHGEDGEGSLSVQRSIANEDEQADRLDVLQKEVDTARTALEQDEDAVAFVKWRASALESGRDFDTDREAYCEFLKESAPTLSEDSIVVREKWPQKLKEMLGKTQSVQQERSLSVAACLANLHGLLMKTSVKPASQQSPKPPPSVDAIVPRLSTAQSASLDSESCFSQGSSHDCTVDYSTSMSSLHRNSSKRIDPASSIESLQPVCGTKLKTRRRKLRRTTRHSTDAGNPSRLRNKRMTIMWDAALDFDEKPTSVAPAKIGYTSWQAIFEDDGEKDDKKTLRVVSAKEGDYYLCPDAAYESRLYKLVWQQRIIESKGGYPDHVDKSFGGARPAVHLTDQDDDQNDYAFAMLRDISCGRVQARGALRRGRNYEDSPTSEEGEHKSTNRMAKKKSIWDDWGGSQQPSRELSPEVPNTDSPTSSSSGDKVAHAEQPVPSDARTGKSQMLQQTSREAHDLKLSLLAPKKLFEVEGPQPSPQRRREGLICPIGELARNTAGDSVPSSSNPLELEGLALAPEEPSVAASPKRRNLVTDDCIHDHVEETLKLDEFEESERLPFVTGKLRFSAKHRPVVDGSCVEPDKAVLCVKPVEPQKPSSQSKSKFSMLPKWLRSPLARITGKKYSGLGSLQDMSVVPDDQHDDTPMEKTAVAQDVVKDEGLSSFDTDGVGISTNSTRGDAPAVTAGESKKQADHLVLQERPEASNTNAGQPKPLGSLRKGILPSQTARKLVRAGTKDSVESEEQTGPPATSQQQGTTSNAENKAELHSVASKVEKKGALLHHPPASWVRLSKQSRCASIPVSSEGMNASKDAIVRARLPDAPPLAALAKMVEQRVKDFSEDGVPAREGAEKQCVSPAKVQAASEGASRWASKLRKETMQSSLHKGGSPPKSVPSHPRPQPICSNPDSKQSLHILPDIQGQVVQPKSNGVAKNSNEGQTVEASTQGQSPVQKNPVQKNLFEFVKEDGHGDVTSPLQQQCISSSSGVSRGRAPLRGLSVQETCPSPEENECTGTRAQSGSPRQKLAVPEPENYCSGVALSVEGSSSKVASQKRPSLPLIEEPCSADLLSHLEDVDLPHCEELAQAYENTWDGTALTSLMEQLHSISSTNTGNASSPPTGNTSCPPTTQKDVPGPLLGGINFLPKRSRNISADMSPPPQARSCTGTGQSPNQRAQTTEPYFRDAPGRPGTAPDGQQQRLASSKFAQLTSTKMPWQYRAASSMAEELEPTPNSPKCSKPKVPWASLAARSQVKGDCFSMFQRPSMARHRQEYLKEDTAMRLGFSPDNQGTVPQKSQRGFSILKDHGASDSSPTQTGMLSSRPHSSWAVARAGSGSRGTPLERSRPQSLSKSRASPSKPSVVKR